MQVMIWDDHVNRCIGELMFKSEVRAVKLRRDRVIVVLLQKVYVYRYVYVYVGYLVMVSPPLPRMIAACLSC